MAGTVKVPGFGEQKSTTVYLIGGAVVVVLGVSVYRARKNKANTAATPTDPTQVDPATGYAYGSPEEAQALAQDSAYQNPADYGGGGGPASAPGSTPAPGAGFTSNAQWTQAATDYLTTTTDLPGSVVLAALGKYIHGEAVVKGSQDDTIIMQAIAAEGQPPQGGQNGFPPSIRHTSAPTPGPVHKAKLARPALRIVTKNTHTHTYRFAWTPVKGAAYYRLYNHGTLITQTTGTEAAVAHTGTAFHVYAYPPDHSATYTRSDASNIVHT